MSEKLDQSLYNKRLVLVYGFTGTILFFLIVRLWYLQGIYGIYYRDQSENNRIRTVRTVPPRGIIYDRNNKILVSNRPSLDVALILEDIPNIDELLNILSEITGREIDQLKRNLNAPVKNSHFEPRVVMADVSFEELAKIRVNSYRLPGVIINSVPTRSYPGSTIGAQLLGYSREITKQQLDSLPNKNEYHQGDLFGQSGLEKQWENNLRGRSGYKQVEVDAMGHRRAELGIIKNLEGNDLFLTVDLDLQQAAENGLAGKRGAVVALDPRNGEVLALASSPAVDANIFSGKIDAQAWEKVSTNKDKPLTNRAISSKYPPGSTYKLFMAMAGLAAKKITPQTHFNCPGYYMFAGRPYKCHKHSGHGSVDLLKAITVSCNVYFYQVGQLLDIENIEKYGKMFGFGELSGIELPGEDPGILPSDEWKRKVHKQKWYPGDTLPVSIGQGYLNVTPLQMAVGISVLANGGKIYRPHIVRKIFNHQTQEEIDIKGELVKDSEIDPKAIETIRNFSISVVNDPHGTGKRAALPGITVAGKTGTAQVGVLGKDKLDERFKDHAWFISFAPAENPMIAMAVIVENSGHGGEFAAPISKQVMEVYFKKLGMLKEEVKVPDNKAQPPAMESDNSDENLPEEDIDQAGSIGEE